MNLISFYSYKGGTGRTTTMANVSVLLAQRGFNVACIDLDFAGPGLDVVYGVDQALLNTKELLASSVSLGALLSFQQMGIEYWKDVRGRQVGKESAGKLYIFPSPRVPETRERIEPMIDEMNRSIEEGLFDELSKDLGVEYVLLDARSGFTREAASIFRFSDKIFVNLRFTSQHLLGSKVILNFIREIQILREILKPLDYFVVINDVPIDLPVNVLDTLKKYKEEPPRKVIIKENKELRWADRIIVLDDGTSKDEVGREQLRELLSEYEEIINLIVEKDG